MRFHHGRSMFGSVVIAALFGASASAQIQLSERSGQLREGSRFVVNGANKGNRSQGSRVSVIVKLEAEGLASYRGGIGGLPATSPAATGASSLDVTTPACQAYLRYLDGKIQEFEDACHRLVPDARLTHRFTVVLGGVSVVVPADQVELLSQIPGVAGVYRDEVLAVDTEVSTDFIGADRIWKQLGGQDEAGEGVIVGVLDTGVWPEHPSYSDPDPMGKPYAAPPVVPGSNGFGPAGVKETCDFGNTAFNPDDAAFTCNNKLIGAYAFLDTYKAVFGLLPDEFDSARDSNGHGTHTSSTAAGNGGVEASLFGVPRGIVSGVAPRAHVVMYRVCGDEGCFTSDSAAAVEQAILDGVDAINFSIEGGIDPFSSVAELAFLNAYDAGVFVAASAGNDGPTANTVNHRGPWTTTVGASTSDRHFLSTVELTSNEGDVLQLTGSSITDGIFAPTSVVFPPAGEELCLTPFPAGTFSGEIVICERGVIARVAKSFNVQAGGASGLLLYNPVLQGLSTDSHFIPSVHLEFDGGERLLDFMATHSGVLGTFTQGVASRVQGDAMAAFSSRGGTGLTLGIAKPDVTAPGVQILAGHSPDPDSVVGGLPGELFQVIQGTSMSSPHVAGAAALVKDLHPDWTPGQIHSALMTTARTKRVFKEDGVTPGDPFDYGAGRIDLDVAGDPGITISDSGANFVALQNRLWDANYPSLYVPIHPGVITVRRTLKSEVSKKLKYHVRVDATPDVRIEVPDRVTVPAHGTANFEITVDARNVPIGEVRHANLELKHKGREANFPISLVRDQAVVVTDKSCAPTVFAEGETTDCAITITNTSFDDANVHVVDRLPRELDLVSVAGATASGNGFTFDGSLFGAAPPIVNAAIDAAAALPGYVPLSIFGIGDIGMSDESIANFSVPSFTYAGETYSTIGIVSNGYVVVGGGSGSDVDFINTDFPDPAVPNNVLAPIWTDLNPSAGGRVLVAILSSTGGDAWTVVEWESVPNWGDGETNTAQVWIGANTDANPSEDIFFTYGSDVSDGDGGFLTVGAENPFGNSGGTVYFDGAGIAPTSTNMTGYAVDVFSTPGAPGETKIISFTARGDDDGEWQNCAEITGDLFFGVSTACEEGEVTDDDDSSDDDSSDDDDSDDDDSDDDDSDDEAR